MRIARSKQHDFQKAMTNKQIRLVKTIWPTVNWSKQAVHLKYYKKYAYALAHKMSCVLSLF